MLDKFGNVLGEGLFVVYPSRPGGKGALQLGFGKVHAVQEALGEVDIEIGSVQGETSRIITVKRTDRLAIVKI